MPRKGARSPGRLECRGQPLRSVARPQRHDEENSGVRWSTKQGAEQVDRRGVGPVDVVEHEHERPDGGQTLEHLAHGAVAAVALVTEFLSLCGREP